MNTIINGLTMGPYSLYVWSAYGLTALVLGISILGIKWQRHRTRKLLKLWLGRQ